LANVCASSRVSGAGWPWGVMRRSGLLTAVFALAVGIAVAFGASPGAPPQPVTALRQVATRTYTPNVQDDTTTQAMSRTGHFMRTSVTSLQIEVGNYKYQGGISFVNGSATITASIEYPLGTCTQVTFNSSTTASVVNNGFALSDPISLSIPAGARFWVRQFYQNSLGTISTQSVTNISNMGDALDKAASGLSDQTVSCTTVTDSGSGSIYTPVAIIANAPNSHAGCVYGDSLSVGTGGTGETVAETSAA